MTWFLFQGLIVFAVICANIYWEFTPNPYIPIGFGVGLGFILSAGLSWLIDAWRIGGIPKRAKRPRDARTWRQWLLGGGSSRRR